MLRTNCKYGFTLIELLVVISIISLLVSILLPSLKSARDLAKRVVCSSNQKSLVMVHILYANENDGLFPPFNSSSADNSTIFFKYARATASGLYPYYADSPRMFFCPIGVENGWGPEDRPYGYPNFAMDSVSYNIGYSILADRSLPQYMDYLPLYDRYPDSSAGPSRYYGFRGLGDVNAQIPLVCDILDWSASGGWNAVVPPHFLDSDDEPTGANIGYVAGNVEWKLFSDTTFTMNLNVGSLPQYIPVIE